MCTIQDYVTQRLWRLKVHLKENAMKFGDPAVDSVVSGCGILALLFVYLGQRSVNAVVVPPSDFPFFATMLWEDEAVCGATLITSSFLFTACHCLLKDPTSSKFKYPHELRNPESITVQAGNDSIRPGGEERIAMMIMVHPKCEGTVSSVVYNYGMIELKEPFTLKPSYIEVVDILSQKDAISQVIKKHDNLTCFSLEFELIQRGDEFWELGALLREDEMMMTGDWCKNTINNEKSKKLHFDPKLQVCAKREIPFEDCEKTDFGGPLICSRGGKNIFIGLLSGRNNLYCGKGVPQVYARVDIAIDWIREDMKPDPATSTDMPGPGPGPGPTTNHPKTTQKPEPEPSSQEREFTVSGKTEHTIPDNVSSFLLPCNLFVVVFSTSFVAVINTGATLY